MTRENLETAVILHGLIHRSLRHTVESLRECVLAPLARLGTVDVFFHSWELAAVHNPRGGERAEVLDVAEVSRCLPEARGLFESQEGFDASVDWERWFRNNPMRHCCGNEEEARATLMNFRRALESQERAWRFFEEKKTKRYDRVVATRADLRFLEELAVPEKLVAALCEHTGGRGESMERFIGFDSHGQPLQAMLWLPKFHSWGGVNDRFAIGNEEGVRTWSNRVAFAEEWLEKAKGESSEWLLMKWLEKKRVRVGFLDFTFQRVRATGQVAEMDREVKPCQSTRTREASAPLKNRFLILAREASSQAEGLRKVLDPMGRVEVVVDRPAGGSWASTLTERRYIHLTDEEVEGFGGLMGRVEDFPRITAWSRAMAHLEATLQEDEAVWFVEDDVAGDAESFRRLVELTDRRNPDLAARDIRHRDHDGNWYFWPIVETHFDSPLRAFQPLCRVSAALLKEVFRFRKDQGAFVFHEVLFASLANRAGMDTLDWASDPSCAACFSRFEYRPEVIWPARGIAHPVKDPKCHEQVCAITPSGFPRIRSAKLDGWSILADDYIFIARLCRILGFRRVVEFGPGASTLALLDGGCEVISFEHDLGWLRHSVGQFANERDVKVIHCPEGFVPEELRFRPDLVFVDGPPYREGQVHSRIGPCEWALDLCGCFLLHDSKRGGELATLEEMERRGLQVIDIPTAKGMSLVVDPHKRPEWMALILEEEGAEGGTGHRWSPDERMIWRVLFHEPIRKARVLQCGGGDGTRANLLLQRIFTHPESEIHVIECFEGPEGERWSRDFESKSCAFGNRERIHLYKGTSREALAWMIATEGFWETFDFVHLNRPSEASELLADACQAWQLIQPGGVLALPAAGTWSETARAFARAYADRLETILDAGWLLVRRLR